MSRLTRRVAVKAKGAAAKTYADFQAHIAMLATGGLVPWASATNSTGAFRTTVDVPTGEMFGTPWSSTFARDTSTGIASLKRVIQHALPSEQVFSAQAGLQIFYRFVEGTNQSMISLTRNGYTSKSGIIISLSCPELIYWDGTQAQRMQPSLGVGPTLYTW